MKLRDEENLKLRNKSKKRIGRKAWSNFAETYMRVEYRRVEQRRVEYTGVEERRVEQTRVEYTRVEQGRVEKSEKIDVS